jgi:uncharacterized damage-inducible protein DinB
MANIDEHGRPFPTESGDEAATLNGFLDYQRATLKWKVSGLDAAALRATTAKSTMTLGGLLKHMALVEDHWFSQWLTDTAHGSPFDVVDFDTDPDWEWRTAADDSPEQLLTLWERFVDQSRRNVAAALRQGDMGQLAAHEGHGERPSLRWIMCHMIEEYARHNGHADLLRESIDGQTGE